MPLSYTVTANYEGLTLDDIEKNILFELGQVVGTEVNYNRFPPWLIRNKLNDRQNKFVFLSQCLRKTALIRLKKDIREFKLPTNCMDGGIIGKPKYYDSATSYVNLDIHTTQWLDEHHEGWLVEDSGDPMYCYMGNSYGNIPMIGLYPKPDTDGTDYTLTPDTGVVIGEDFPGTITNVTGIATSGAATTLGDTAVDFRTLGLCAGMHVDNVTDGSSATITVIAEHAITLTTLAGGTANVFAAGDSYEILAGEYGVITSWEEDDVVIFGSEIGAASNITVPAGNLRVDYIPYPIPFPASGNPTQYPEIPKMYHMALVYGVVSDLLSSFHESSKEFSRSKVYEEKFNASAMSARSKKEGRPFKDKRTTFHPKMRRG